MRNGYNKIHKDAKYKHRVNEGIKLQKLNPVKSLSR